MKSSVVSFCVLGLVGPWFAAIPATAQQTRSDQQAYQSDAADGDDLLWSTDNWQIEPGSSGIELTQAAEPAAAAADSAAATPANAVAAGSTTSAANADTAVAGDADAAALRAAHDAGTLLRDLPGITVDAHAPNIHETALRGRRLGQVPAKGSYWFPARQDLDTLMSKIDSTMVEEIIVYKGPYTALYGPGLAFYDVELLKAPRYEVGSEFQSHCTSILQYETNGEQYHGRQAFWGGDETWGYRGGYSHRGGSDYETGAGDELPSSYKSRQTDVALGGWLSPDSRIDVQYLRLDQTDVEFPGQFFDINALVTDGVELFYELQNQDRFDLLTADTWYNRTDFYGDNLRPGKRSILPLDNVDEFVDPFGFTNRFTTTNNSFTDVSSYSTGFRLALGWGDRDGDFVTAGVDMRYLKQEIEELNNIDFLIEVLDPAGNPVFPPIMDTISASNPLPKAHSSNPGAFTEWQHPLTEQLSTRTGGRVDWVAMNADQTAPGVAENISDALGGPFDQDFVLGSGFLSLDYQATEEYVFNTGVGFGMRPPTMTEMYAYGPFVAVLPQYIFTSVFGDPNLDPEQLLQLDLGVSADYGYTRAGVSVYHAWVEDYITLDFLDNRLPNGAPASSAYAYVNTPLATLAGAEAYGECDISHTLTGFGTLSYVEGRDHSRLETISRQRELIAPGTTRSQAFDVLTGLPIGTGPTSDEEPLAVIAPLAGRLGCRLHTAEERPTWNVEFAANVIDNQDRVATSLRELMTPGFTTYDVVGFYRVGESSTLTAGVRNLTDKYYQTYFDTRQAGTAPITRVFQPGITFIFGWEYTR